MTVFVVVDHICEADIVVGVFSACDKADAFVQAHKDDRLENAPRVRKYEALAIELHELDGL